MFNTIKEATVKVKMHALQSRRAISVLICDNQRVRAKCYDIVLGSTKFTPTLGREEDMPSTSNTQANGTYSSKSGGMSIVSQLKH